MIQITDKFEVFKKSSYDYHIQILLHTYIGFVTNHTKPDLTLSFQNIYHSVQGKKLLKPDVSNKSSGHFLNMKVFK